MTSPTFTQSEAPQHSRATVEGVVTSAVTGGGRNGTSGQPHNQPTFATLIERANTVISAELLERMQETAKASMGEEAPVTKGLMYLIKGRDKCLRIRSRQDQPTEALAARYDRFGCQEDPTRSYARPKVAPCYGRSDPKCEEYWAKKEVEKRRRKMDTFVQERDGASLLLMTWPGLDREIWTAAWRAFRRSRKRPHILKRALFFPEETVEGLNIYVLSPAMTREEMDDLQDLWGEITSRYAVGRGTVTPVAPQIPPGIDLTDMADELAEYEAEHVVASTPPPPLVSAEVVTVSALAAALYMLVRKSLFILVLEGKLTPMQGVERFAQVLEKGAALFGEDMQAVDERTEDARDTEQNDENSDFRANVPPRPREALRVEPCVIHEGQHNAEYVETVDFALIEELMRRNWGNELDDGTFVITIPVPPYRPFPVDILGIPLVEEI